MSEREPLTQLRQLIADHFDEEELRSLCFDLGKSYDQLPGRGTEAKARELVDWCNRHGRLPDLYARLQELRPGLDWGASPGLPTTLAGVTIFPLHHLPFQRNPNFTGRGGLLERIRQNLRGEKTTAVPLVIAGLGGVGKTQVALEYAYRYQSDYDLIWWLSAEDTAALGADFSTLASTLSLAGPAVSEQEVLVSLVLRWLAQSEHKQLLVFDNADTLNPANFQSYLPKGGPNHLLVTSQNPNWGGVANVLRLDIFSEEEAVAFLQQRVQNATINDARTLAQALGYFPLALAHAAAYAEATGATLLDYLALYTTRRQALWQRAQPPSNYHATIATTWDLAFQKVEQSEPAALDLLKLCCFLAPDDIPLSLLRQQADHLPDSLAETVRDLLALDDAIAALRRYSMLAREGDRLSLHRLVQAVTRDRMDEAEARWWMATAVTLLAAAWPFQDHDLATWEPSQRLLPHLLAVTERALKYQIKTEKTAYLCHQIGAYLHLQGDLSGAKPCYERALTDRKAILGDDHPDTAQTLNKLGHLLWNTGDLEQARNYLERALAIREAAFGPDRPEVADSLDLLGDLKSEQGDDAAARPYLERALAIREKALGPDHPDTGQSLNNLAVVINALGETEAAQQLYERAVAIWEQDPGPEHPKICQGLYNLGLLLQDQGDWPGARQQFERALSIWEKTLGPDHPHTAFALAGLGNLLRDMGELAAARPYLERSLAARENALGPDHSMTAFSLRSLGWLHHQQGELAVARPYFERALHIWQTAHGPNHAYTAMGLNDLGIVLRDMGELEEARPYLEQAVASAEYAWGQEHPSTARSYTSLAKLLVQEDNMAEARTYFERALAILQAKLGPDHARTQDVRDNLAALDE